MPPATHPATVARFGSAAWSARTTGPPAASCCAAVASGAFAGVWTDCGTGCGTGGRRRGGLACRAGATGVRLRWAVPVVGAPAAAESPGVEGATLEGAGSEGCAWGAEPGRRSLGCSGWSGGGGVRAGGCRRRCRGRRRGGCACWRAGTVRVHPTSMWSGLVNRFPPGSALPLLASHTVRQSGTPWSAAISETVSPSCTVTCSPGLAARARRGRRAGGVAALLRVVLGQVEGLAGVDGGVLLQVRVEVHDLAVAGGVAQLLLGDGSTGCRTGGPCSRGDASPSLLRFSRRSSRPALPRRSWSSAEPVDRWALGGARGRCVGRGCGRRWRRCRAGPRGRCRSGRRRRWRGAGRQQRGGDEHGHDGGDQDACRLAPRRPADIRRDVRRDARGGRRPREPMAATASCSTERVNQAHPSHTSAARTANTPWPVRSGPITARHTARVRDGGGDRADPDQQVRDAGDEPEDEQQRREALDERSR